MIQYISNNQKVLQLLFVCLLLNCCIGGVEKGNELDSKTVALYNRRFSESPELNLKKNIAKGDYRYWAFRKRADGSGSAWIPGIANKGEKLNSYDFVSLGLEVNDCTFGAAEKYFKSYNLLLKSKRPTEPHCETQIQSAEE